MEVINFRVGNRLVAFNILNILLTEKFDDMQTSVPSEDAAFLGVKDFMGVPTPIYDLGIAMNKESTKQKNQKLNSLLHNREQDHSNWLDALESSLTDNIPFAQARDPHLCELGKWLESFQTDNTDLSDVLAKMDEPHKRIHSLAEKLLTMKANNQVSEAIKILHTERNTTLATLKRLFEAAREQVEATYKPVTVFTTIDGQHPSLGFVIDKVEDSLHADEKDIKPLLDLEVHAGKIDHRVKNMMVNLITAGEKNSLLLKPEAFL